MEPDLSATLTKHPHPSFMSLSRPPSHASQQAFRLNTSNSVSSHGRTQSDGGEAALSTGVESMSGSANDKTLRGDAVSRHTPADAMGAAQTDIEVESQMRDGQFPQYGAEKDPYGLSARYKTRSELEQIKANTSRKVASRRAGAGADYGEGILGGTSAASAVAATGTRLGGSAGGGGFGFETGLAYRKLAGCLPLPEFGRAALQVRGVQGFYEAQNATIERLLKSVEEHRAAARQEQGADHVRFQIAVYGSFAANLALAALQIYGAISSGSLSLYTTMADAIFDPLSNVTLIITNRAVRRVDPSRFPSGKARLETVGNIVFCFLMTAVSFILIAFSARELADGRGGGSSDLNSFHLPSVIAVAVAFVTKLVLLLYTWSIKDRYSQIRILWSDHRNDLIINGFGLLTSVGGSKLVWWIDPAGAIVLSLVISVIWLRTAFLEFLLLVGVVASVDAQQLITYVCLTHSPAVRQIDTVRVYHSGPRLIAEVDVVMDPEATLMATHDVAEALQFKLESLPDVERAYVHVDYETTHRPEHAYRKDL